MPDVSAVVLHGTCTQPGMADCAPLEGQAQRLLEEVWSALTTLSDDCLIVVDDARSPPQLSQAVQAGARLVVAHQPHLWPMGAIHAALLEARHERSIIVASHMPLINLPLFRYMILLAADYDVVVARMGGRVEPLPAVYSRAGVGPLELALVTGEERIDAVLPGLRVRYVDDTEVETFDPNHLSFFRVQSAADWESLPKQPWPGLAARPPRGAPLAATGKRPTADQQRTTRPRKPSGGLA